MIGSFNTISVEFTKLYCKPYGWSCKGRDCWFTGPEQSRGRTSHGAVRDYLLSPADRISYISTYLSWSLCYGHQNAISGCRDSKGKTGGESGRNKGGQVFIPLWRFLQGIIRVGCVPRAGPCFSLMTLSLRVLGFSYILWTTEIIAVPAAGSQGCCPWVNLGTLNIIQWMIAIETPSTVLAQWTISFLLDSDSADSLMWLCCWNITLHHLDQTTLNRL